MTVTPTELRANLYRLLDQVLATGEPLLIHRGGQTLRVELAREVTEPDVFASLPIRDDYVVDREGAIEVDWLANWTAGRDL